MIRFRCPECGKQLKSPESYGGRQVQCTRCRRSLQAPAAPAGSGPVGVAPAQSAPGSVRFLAGLFTRPRASGRKRRWLLAVGCAAVGVLLAIAGLLLLLPGAVDRDLTDLKSADPNRSRPALEWLAAAEPQDAQRARVTAALEPLLLDGDAHGGLDPDLLLRTYLAWAGKDTVPALIRMMQTPAPPYWNPKKTALVIEALGKTQDGRAAEALAAKLSDPVLHDPAVGALESMGPKAQTAVLPYLFDADPATRLMAGRLLADLGAKPPTIFNEALARLQSGQADVRRAAVGWFVDNSPGEGARKDDAAQALAGLLDDPAPEVRGQALQALKSWATDKCLPALLAYARREQKAPAGEPLLIDVLAQFPDEIAAEAIALQLPNAATRGKAVQALLGLGPAATQAVLPYIDHPDAAVQKEARGLCRRLNVSADLQLGQTLADAADARIPRSRAALEHLAALRPDESVRAKVSQALNAPLLDPHAAIRDEALAAVQVWGTPANTTALLKVLGDVRGGEKDAARVIDLLGSLKDPKAAPALAHELTLASERGPASKALVAIGPAAEEAVLPILQGADPGARIAACWVVGEIGTTKSLQPLQDAISTAPGGPPGDALVWEAQQAMQKIGARK